MYAHTHTHTHTHTRILTVSVEQLAKVYGDHLPLAVVGAEAPEADVHGAGARLAVHAAEVQRLAGEVVHVPTLALVGGEPGGGRQTLVIRCGGLVLVYKEKPSITSLITA